jgi:type IV pilus assembly protein PilW
MNGNLRPRGPMAGMSIIELMIAIALGLIVLAGLATLFANQSAARQEMERSTRQIENGRFAMELLSDDLRMAGFWGELNLIPANFPVPGALIDPCSFTKADWVTALPLHVQGYDNGAGAPACMPADLRPGTDIVVVRRVSTCEAGTANCNAVVNGTPYIQVARCATEVAVPLQAYELGQSGTEPFVRTQRDCATRASLRQYIVRIYYVANVAQPAPLPVLPTLKRLDFNAATNAWVETSLADGIEELHLEYGIDTDGDADPDVYTADPTTYVCAGCTAASNWSNVTTARIYVLARNNEATVNYTDPKTYTLGRTAAGLPNTIDPVDKGFRRHAYSGLVRIINVSERRDVP